MTEFLAKILTVLLLLLVLNPLDAFAKKDKFTLAADKKFKPRNIKVIERVWSKGLKPGSPGKRYHPEESNPVVFAGVVYVGTHGGYFYAVESGDGDILWQYENDEPIAATAAVTQDKVFFTDLGGRVIALSRADGRLLWKQYLGREMLGQPLISGERLILLKGEQEVVALSQADGQVVWNRFIRTFVRDITMRGQPGLVENQGSLYVGLADGHLYKLKAADGKTVWQKNLTIPLRTFKDIDGHVVVAGNSLYVGGYFGAVYRINKTNGSIIWAADVATGVPVALTGDRVIVSDKDGTLHGLDKKDGTEIWFQEFDGGVISAPVVFDGRIFVTTYKGKAYLIDPADGSQLQQLAAGDGSINRPAVEGERLYILTSKARLMAFGRK